MSVQFNHDGVPVIIKQQILSVDKSNTNDGYKLSVKYIGGKSSYSFMLEQERDFVFKRLSNSIKRPTTV